MKSLLFFLLITVQITFGQENHFVFLKKTPLQADRYVGSDAYGGIYYIRNNQLFKKNKSKVYQFEDIQLGGLTTVDVLNPLQVVLFYKGTNTVVFLDHHLIEIHRVLFNSPKNYKNLRFASLAAGNKLWLFNVDTQEIQIYDYARNKVIAKSQPINMAVGEVEGNYNFLWLLHKDSTLVCYNTYGTEVERICCPMIQEFEVGNDRLIGKTDQGFVLWNKKSNKFALLNLSPQVEFQGFFLNNNKLYIYDGAYLYVYQLKKNK